MPSPILRACAGLAAVTLGACSAPYHPPVFIEPNPVFPGLIDLAAGKPVDVLMVHGICSHDASWASDVVRTLTRDINANLPSPALRPKAEAGIEVVSSTVGTPYGSLRFNGLIWSPLTRELKRQLCYDETDKSAICQDAPPFTPTRAKFNARAKDLLIDDCVPDALIYEGVSHDAMRQRMREAVMQVLEKDGNAPEAPLVVVAESMGSKYLFDTLLRMTQEVPDSHAASLAQRAVDRMQYLVMAGNQIPLLALADQQTAAGLSAATGAATGASAATGATAPHASAAPPGGDSLQQLLQMRRAWTSEARNASTAGAQAAPAAPTTQAAQTHLVLIAFSDPSDVLSYTLQREKYARDGIDVYNILVSNGPTYLGLLERPDTAHLNYLENPDVARLITCGQPTSTRCK